jgi:hypothetical protein
MQNNWRIRSLPLKGAGHRTIGFKWRRNGNLSGLASKFVECAHQISRTGVLQGKSARRVASPAHSKSKAR